MKVEDGTNVHSGIHSMLEGGTVDRSTAGVMQEKSNIEEAEQPSSYRDTRTVKDGAGSGLDSLKMLFSRILMLLMGFTLSASNEKGTKDALDLFASFNLSMITDELVWCTILPDVILESIDKLLDSLL